MFSTSNTRNQPTSISQTIPLLVIGFIWMAYLITYLFVQHYDWSLLPAIVDNGMLIVLTIAFFALWSKAEKGSTAKLLFSVFLISRFFAFGESVIYYGVRHLLHLTHLTSFWSDLNDTFSIITLVLISLSFLLILLSAKVNAKKSINIYIPVILAIAILFGISFYVIKWHPSNAPITMGTWSTSVYALAEKTLEIVFVIIAALCVATAKNKRIFYFALGFSILLATDVILVFGFFSQEYGIGSAFESGYFLGYLLILYGLILLYKSKDFSNVRAWTVAPDSVRGQLSYWFTALSLISVVLAVIAAKVVMPTVFNNQWQPFLPTILIICIVFSTMLSNIVAKKLTKPFQKLKTLIDDFLHTDKAPNPEDLAHQNLYLAEFKQLQEFLVQAFSAIQEKRKTDREGFVVASQVAHDINSPLASLLMVTQSCTDIPENTRITMREAINNIRDIAQNLLRRYENGRIKDSNTEIATKEYQPVLVALILSQLIIDKRHQYQNLPVSFDSQFSSDSSFAFIQAAPTDFKRMLSNLINNAVDALDGNSGQITLQLEVDSDRVKIVVLDTGKGMPKDVINKITQNIAVTKDKKNGHGIGFTQTMETLKNNQGEIAIDSKTGYGTKITLIFPRVAPAAWLATELEICAGDTVVVLDDDSSIHGAWDERFKKYINANEMSIKHFQAGSAALDFLNQPGTAKNKIFLLADYELLKQNLNGIDVIERAALPKGRSLLVTSHYANQAVLDHAAKIGIKILPKQLAAEIPIKLSANVICTSPAIAASNKKAEVVIVDDDKLFLDTLKYVITNQHSKIVDTYNHPQAFLDNLRCYPKDTKICLDNNLSCSIGGIELAKQLHKEGYRHLYLLSGSDFAKGEIPSFITPILKTDIEKFKRLIL